ncbi:MAG: hypothetical protein OXE53_00905 [Deltaproteobacteria bacterium]|nr:hypothetical protein [Deltaproteobacteria bacterium]
MLKKHTTSVLVLAIGTLLAVALSGCGGGGGGSMGTMPDPTPEEPDTSNLADVIGRAAGARPVAGSVTQSSNVDANGVTLDRIEVAAQYDETNVLCFSIQNGTHWSIGFDEGDRRPIPGLPSPWKGAVMEKRVSGGLVSVVAYSDISQSDTDYLAGGAWLFVPDDVTNSAAYVAGTFADGTDPFRQEDIQPLQGSATYRGRTMGTYSLKSFDSTGIASFEIDAFNGVISLMADFGDGGGLGTISGSVTDVEVDDEVLEATLNLGTAAIGSSGSGFFEGEATGDAEGLTLAGRWGGQFFGNGQADGMPGAVAGTFGGHSTDNTANFVGAFGAHKQ